MIFKISGANAKTGADCTISVAANSESEAMAIAREKGVFPTKMVRDTLAEKTAEEQKKKTEIHEAARLFAAKKKLQKEEKIVRVKTEILNRLDSGLPVYLYETVYLPVNSGLLGESLSNGFDIPKLRRFGMLGWEVIQIVPRTIGIGLENISIGSTMGNTYGGGCGGNVVGVHVILKKRFESNDLKHDGISEIEEHIRSNLSSFE